MISRNLLSIAVLAFTPAMVGQSNLPANKQAIDQQYQQQRAAGAANPAPKTPPTSLPAVGNYPFEQGILDDCDPPFPESQVSITSCWQGLQNSNEVFAYAGADGTNTQQGLLILMQGASYPASVTGQTILTPVQAGAVTIVNDTNGVLTLVSATGAYVMTFDTTTGAFSNTVVDTTPPLISPTITGILGNNGWYRSSVSVSWSVSDPESGIQSSSCAPSTLTADTAGVTLTCTAVDNVGLSNSASVVVKIDQTAPVLSVPTNLSVNATSNSGIIVNYSASATDNLDPGPVVACIPVSGSTFTVGTTPVTCTATDAAGNQSVGTFNVTVTAPTTGTDDLVLVNLASPLVRTGQRLTYVIGVANLGSTAGAQVVVTDNLPPGTKLISATWVLGSCSASGGALSCPAPATGTPCLANGSVLSCTIGALAPFSLKNPVGVGIAIVTQVTAVAGSTLRDTASVTSLNLDTHPSNNSMTAATRVTK